MNASTARVASLWTSMLGRLKSPWTRSDVIAGLAVIIAAWGVHEEHRSRHVDNEARVVELLGDASLLLDQSIPPLQDASESIGGDSQDAQSNRRAAVQKIQIAISHEPDSERVSWAHELMGVSYFQDRAFSLTIEECQKAVALNPNNVDAYVLLGRAETASNNLELAKQALNKALQAEPSNVSALNALGEVSIREQRYHDAEGYLARAQQAAPNDALTQFEFGKLFASEHRFREADRAFRASTIGNRLRMPSKSAIEAYLELGRLHRSIGDFDEAERAFRTAVAIQKDSSIVIGNLAMLLAERAHQSNEPLDSQRNKEAETLLLKGISLSPNSWKMYHGYGLFLLWQGRLQDSIRFLTTAQELPGSPDFVRKDLATAKYCASNPKICKGIPTPAKSGQH